MKKDLVTPYAIEEPAEGESGFQLIQATLGVESEIELIVGSGGPVFLFRGPVSPSDLYLATHSPSPSFDLCASVGMVARCYAPSSVGQIMVCSDIASIGHIRQVSC